VFLEEDAKTVAMDRLARSTRDLLSILDTIAKAGAGFKSWAMLGRTRSCHMAD
jgi:hypothetical protein